MTEYYFSPGGRKGLFSSFCDHSSADRKLGFSYRGEKTRTMIEQVLSLKPCVQKKIGGGDFFYTQNSKYRTHTNLQRPILIANWKIANSFATKARMEASKSAIDAQRHLLWRGKFGTMQKLSKNFIFDAVKIKQFLHRCSSSDLH